ncbi:thiopurine S-methyltransferase, partial [Amaricoccus sp. HAR-UPW-R2A-40]
RGRYAAHLAALTGTAPQLLLAFDYDQAQLAGPPFSVTEAEIRALYEPGYRVTGLERRAGATPRTWRP